MKRGGEGKRVKEKEIKERTRWKEGHGRHGTHGMRLAGGAGSEANAQMRVGCMCQVKREMVALRGGGKVGSNEWAGDVVVALVG
jgi:hypothetical protein